MAFDLRSEVLVDIADFELVREVVLAQITTWREQGKTDGQAYDWDNWSYELEQPVTGIRTTIRYWSTTQDIYDYFSFIDALAPTPYINHRIMTTEDLQPPGQPILPPPQ